MGMNSILGTAIQGLHQGAQGLRRVASEIASPQKTSFSKPTDLSRAMVEMQQHAIQAKASIKAMKSADETLGSLFDERV
jgi:hypothetical protein